MTPTPPADRPVSRRLLLRAGGLAGLVGAIGATGCTVSDPRIQSAGGSAPPPGHSSTTTPTPTPAPAPVLPGAAAGAAAEEQAANLAGALLKRTDTSGPAALTDGQRRLLTAARDAHRLHAQVLRTPDPVLRSTDGATPAPTPGPSVRPAPVQVSLAAMIATEKSLASRHGALVSGSRGLAALLFGSLSTAAGTYATALGATGTVPLAKTPVDPPAPEVLDDVAGAQAVVAQLHAMIWGYQVAIGRLPIGSAVRDRALAGLIERRALRDRLITLLINRRATVPAAEPAYATSGKVRDAATATALIAALETAFVPFTGQWLAAAAQPGDQTLAWQTMRDTAATARAWGGPVSAWPGWPG